MTSERTGRYREFAVALLSTTCVFLAILLGTGSLFSGYHLVDDGLSIDTLDRIKNYGILDTLSHYIWRDFTGARFRPLFRVCIALRTLLYGTDMNKWMIHIMVEGIASSLFIYYTGRNMGLKAGGSALIALVCIFGQQFDIWVRAIHQENTGVLLLSSVFWMISLRYSAKGENSCRWGG